VPKCHTAHTPAAVNNGEVFLQSPGFSAHLQKKEAALGGLVELFAHAIQFQNKRLHGRKWQV